jgi:hypothetical protein
MKLKEYKWKRCELRKDFENELIRPGDYLFMSDNKYHWFSIGISKRGLSSYSSFHSVRKKFNPNLKSGLPACRRWSGCKDEYWNYKQKDLLEMLFNNYKMEDLVEGLLCRHKVAMWLRNHGHL